MKSIQGIACLVFGIGIIIYNIRDRRMDKKDTYGGRIKLYGAASIAIILGLTLIYRDLD